MFIVREFCLAIVLILSHISFSYACDFKNLLFGSSAQQMIDSYNLRKFDPFIEVESKGEFKVPSMGVDQCKDLPQDSLIEYTFIDDVFVKVFISNPHNSDELLKFANKIFGDSDDVDRALPQTNKRAMAVWNVGGDSVGKSVIYTAESNSEGLGIFSNSKTHKVLFDKVIETKGKEIDEYLKSKQSSGEINKDNGTSNEVTSDGLNKNYYDPNSLKDLEEKYRRANESWKKNNNEINKGR